MLKTQTPPSFALPDSIITTEMLSAVRYELARELEWRKQAAVKALVTKKAPKGEEVPTRSLETQGVIDAWVGGGDATEEDVTDLAKYLADFRPVTVHVILAALPNRDQSAKLVSWFRKNCRQDLLVSFTADRTIGGGVVVRTPNRVFDLSFREKLSAGRSHIGGIVRGV